MTLLRSVVAHVVVASVAGGFGCGGGGGIAITTARGAAGAAFADGADLHVEQLLVSFGELDVGDADKVINGPVVVEVSSEDAVVVATVEGLGVARAPVSAAVVPAGEGAATVVGAGAVSDEDLGFMQDNGFSVFIKGDAVVDGAAESFAWGFSKNSRYVDCDDGTGEPGVAVTEGAITEWQLTLHPERLFADSLAAPKDADLRFAPIAAADDNDDGAIDVDELNDLDVEAVAASSGAPYDDGGADVVTLFDFLGAQSRNLIGSNGTGACTVEKR